MNNIIERINIYAKYKKTTKAAIERESGLPNATFKPTTQSLRTDAQSKIAKSFPDLNIGWLLTGEGNMLKDQSVSTNSENTNQQQNEMNVNDFLKALAEEQSLTREALAQNARLIGIIERLHGIDGVGTRISPPLQNRDQVR